MSSNFKIKYPELLFIISVVSPIFIFFNSFRTFRSNRSSLMKPIFPPYFDVSDMLNFEAVLANPFLIMLSLILL